MSKEKSATAKRRERALQRTKEKKRLTAVYKDSKKSLKKMSFDDYPVLSKEEFVKTRLKDWERNQEVILTNKYQDWENKAAKFQQKYVENIITLCPDAIEELKPLVPLFDKLFSQEKTKFYNLFESSREIIFYLASDVESYIGSDLGKVEQVFYDPKTFENVRDDYLFGNFKLLFEIIYLLFVSDDKDQKDKVAEHIKKDLKIQNLSADIADVEKAENLATEYILSRVLDEDFLRDLINRELSEYFNNASLPEDIKSFIKINLGLMKWAEKYNAEKDWLLLYAYDLIRQFSENKDLQVTELEVGIQSKSSFHLIPFNFSFDGWIPSQDRKTYEKTLRSQFEKRIETYFQFIGKTFSLDDKKLSTRPPTFKLLKHLVRKNLQNWNEEKIVELEYGINDSISEEKEYKRKVSYLKEEFSKLSEYDLPI